MPIALFALTLSAFAIGTTEFVIVGLVPTIAADLGGTLPSAWFISESLCRGCGGWRPCVDSINWKMEQKARSVKPHGTLCSG